MTQDRVLNGKLECIYDFTYDILTFHIKNRDYKMSVEVQNFIIDIDTEDFVIGVRVIDASKVFGLKKDILRNIVQSDFQSVVKDNVITVRLTIVGKIRNKIIGSIKQEFAQQVTVPLSEKTKVEDSEIIAEEILA
ncbi:DUF2283 domain-containing protein [Candidatus Woesearchaeota archaeon]|nr:DUF2283 domain-containing protein [Candidatus Woesearchaeota archaeon]